MRKNEYISLLREKFGSQVMTALLPDLENLKLRSGDGKMIYTQNLSSYNRETIKGFIPSEYYDLVQSKEWAFDFPSWVGTLDFSKENVKEIMVVGMEPHIRDRYYQATYGLRETDDSTYGELDEGGNKRLWSNLNGLFGRTVQYKSYEFLSRFYVTDMSHFAVKGFAKEMYNVSDWRKIRNNVAEIFLTREIKLIRPKYIVSQGNDVADFIDNRILEKSGKMVKIKSPRDFESGLLPARCTGSPMFKKFMIDDQNLIHIRLPHLASGNGNYFWIPAKHNSDLRGKRLEGIKNELLVF